MSEKVNLNVLAFAPWYEGMPRHISKLTAKLSGFVEMFGNGEERFSPGDIIMAPYDDWLWIDLGHTYGPTTGLVVQGIKFDNPLYASSEMGTFYRHLNSPYWKIKPAGWRAYVPGRRRLPMNAIFSAPLTLP